MTPEEYCRQKVASPGSALHYATLYLDPRRRAALHSVHAFQNEIADIIDNCRDIEPAHARMAWWRIEIDKLYERGGATAGHPVAQALSHAIGHFPIEREQLLEIIDGHADDLHQWRYPDFKALQLYCYRVASTVSLIGGEILGYRERATAKCLHELGLAGALTDMVRTVGQDARQGRIYIPLDEMERFGVMEDDIFDARHSDNFAALMAFQAERAASLHVAALARLPRADRHPQRALLALAALRQTTLDEIGRDGYRVLDRRLSLTPLRRLWITTRVWLRG